MNVTLSTVSFLEKVFPTGEPQTTVRSGKMLKNERFCFQLCGRTDEGLFHCDIEVRSTLTPFIKIYAVGYVPVFDVDDAARPHDDFYLFDRGYLMPDPLFQRTAGGFKLVKDINNVFAVEIFHAEGVPVGRHELELILKDEKGEALASTVYELEVLDEALPQSRLKKTDWIHFDCLQEYFGKKFLSPEYMEILGRFLDEYVAEGNNVILTPLFSVCLDTDIGAERPTVQLIKVKKRGDKYRFDFSDFEIFVRFMQAHGIVYFEFSHLFTQWGAKACPKVIAEEHGKEVKLFGWECASDDESYRNFLAEFLPELKKELVSLGIDKNVFFHVSDEPTEENIATYRKHREFLAPYLSDFSCIDAVSDRAFADYIDIPVIAVDHYEKFADLEREKWGYYCCGQHDSYVPNLFIAMPLIRTRVIGVLLYKCNAAGLLHWGYNFWFSALSRARINPYADNDCLGHFPAGDAFLVYPSETQGVVPSLRGRCLSRAVDDYRLLQLAEERVGRDAVLALLEEHGYHDFKTYPHTETEFCALREDLLRTVKENRRKQL